MEITEEEYARLKEADSKMNALYAHGIDNWEGYYDAMDSIREED